MTAAPSLVRHVSRVLLRDLDALVAEMEAYPDERDLWVLPPGVRNSAGTLVLHLAGNLQHLVGAQLGDTGYVRDRAAEFADRDVPRADLVRLVRRTRDAVRRTLLRLEAAALEKPFPLGLDGPPPSTGLFLVHLATHLAYHLGQIDLHRRLVTGDAGAVGALAIPEDGPGEPGP